MSTFADRASCAVKSGVVKTTYRATKRVNGASLCGAIGNASNRGGAIAAAYAPGGGGQLREKSSEPIEVALLGLDQVYKAVWRFGKIRRHRDDFNPKRKIPCPTPAGSFVRAD